MKNKIILIIAAVVLIGVSFYSGMRYGGNNVAAASAARGTFQGRTNGGTTRGPSGFAQGGATSGEVIAKDANSLTLKLQSGGSRIAFVSSSTPVIQSIPGSLGDITVGKQITVTGSTNQDGSLNVSSIRVGDLPIQIRNGGN